MEDLKVYGRYNTVTCVNPFRCYFLATYPDGRVIRGRNLINTGWDDIPNGLKELQYVLSTGQLITIPKFRAYLPLIEVSQGMDGSKMFHNIAVKCLAEKEVLTYTIVLRQTPASSFKIGDIVIGREEIPKEMSRSWKFADGGF